MSDDDDCQIVEDNTNYKSITCEKIPDLFLDKLIAKKHFGKYGRITRFVLRPSRFCCTVDYEREDEAANALENAAFFNGHDFIIRYSQREVGHVQNTEEWVDPDVQAELDAMGNHARRMSQHPAPKPIVPTARIKQKPPARTAPDPPASNVPKVSSAVRAELEAILRKPAYTDEDKYRILDARDKLIRLTTVRTTDINKVVSIKGTCPDMCPEKERFMREFQHQVSSFEMEEGGSRSEMNHNIAVKEYSRSSADQEVPLTHELRPEPVLKMTMLYLMQRIMGLCDVDDVNIGDWFHFVWDRTRSVRKDITQQELCSTGAVELVEQCARFHIHCAARLVAEDPSVFDQKINTENLTKCLQTLKYMYNDLRIKGIRCEREAEFRGYIVLLNLNDANFLWELQQLPSEIQHSEGVRSAINFYKCMENNNYVRFFNLVRETTYMNACILLRYFTQVRLKALRMIMKAYNWPKHTVSLPLHYLTKILGFENADAAVDFFAYYGLECDQYTVRLDKNAFDEPDVPVIMERAFDLVESKRQVGVGEAVCGHPLESESSFANHRPHNSFDSNGYLRYESFTAVDQIKEDDTHKTPTRTAADTVFKVPAPSPPLNPKHQLKTIFATTSTKPETEPKTTNLFGQPVPPANASIFSQKPASTPASASIFKIPVLAATGKPAHNTASLFSNTVFEQNSKPNGSSQESSNIFGSTTSSFANDNIFKHFDATPFDVKPTMQGPSLMVQEEKKEKERQLKLQEEERLRELADERRRKEEEEQDRQRRLVEERQRQQLLEENRRKAVVSRISESSEMILNEILNEVQQDQISHIAFKELQDHRRIEKLAENVIFEYISEFVQKIHSEELSIMQRDQSLLHKYFHSWRELLHKMKTQRKLVATMPVWMTADTLDQQAEKMAHPRQVENLQMIKRYRLGIPCDFKRLLDGEERGSPIDLFDVLRRQFSAQQRRLPTGFLKRRKYFKLIISTPDERDELPGFNSYTSSWLAKNTKRRQIESTPAFLCHSDDDLALCIRTVSCIAPKNEKNQKVTSECDHADALLFLMSPGNPTNSRKRLHHLLKLSTINRSVPVAVVMYNSPAAANIATMLDLKSLVDDGKVSSFHVFNSNDQKLKSDFQNSLQFLAKSDDYSFPLEAQNIVSFLNACIGAELWRKLHRSWCTNPSFRKICSIPRFLVEIYNEAVSRLVEIIDEDFLGYPDFPDELRQFVPRSHFDVPVGLEQFSKDWKDVNNTQKLIKFLKKLTLPPVIDEPPCDVEDLDLWLMNYTSECILDNDNASSTAGLQAIKYLIDELNQSDLEEIPVDERLPFISWLPIIQQVALAVLNHQWDSASGELSTDVVYNREEFYEFQSNPWWLESNPVKSVKMVHGAEETVPNETESTADIDDVFARAEKISAETEDKLREMKREANAAKVDPELTRELDNILYSYEVNEKCRSFEGAAGGSITDDEDSLEMPPLAKKFKESPEKMDVNEVMERAFEQLKQRENQLLPDDKQKQNGYYF